MWGDEFCGCFTKQVRDQSSEIRGEIQKFEYSDQLFVVGGGKCPLKIEVAEDDVLLVRKSVLHTKP